MPERSLVIKVTVGKEDPERCNQAFTVAAAAVASGVPVSLWLTGESAWYCLPGRAGDFSLPHAAPLADLLAGVLAAGSVTVCTQCAARRNIEAGDLITGIRIAGAATFVAEIMTEGAQALVYLPPCAPGPLALPAPLRSRPDALKPGFHGVRTPWIRGFMAFQLARRTRIVMLMVLA
jgi:predicted peroxiredoxin